MASNSASISNVWDKISPIHFQSYFQRSVIYAGVSEQLKRGSISDESSSLVNDK